MTESPQLPPLITPAQVVALAYADSDWMADEVITPEQICLVAEERLLPVIGRALYDRLADGAYPDLLRDYVAPALAYCVRLRAQAFLNVRCTRYGLITAEPEGWAPVDHKTVMTFRNELRHHARAHLKRLSDHLDASPGRYAEYDPDHNILHRCRMYGNLVQTV